MKCLDYYIIPNVNYFWQVLFMATLLQTLVIQAIFYNILRKYCYYIEFLLFIYMFTYYGTSQTLVDIKVKEFGVVFEFVYLAFLLIQNGLCFFIYSIYKCVKYFKGKTLIGICFCIGLVFFIIFLHFQNLIEQSCEGWEKGITGQIDFETPGYCIIQKPTKCMNKVLLGKIDLSRGKECQLEDKDGILNRWITQSDLLLNQTQIEQDNSNIKAIGFPNSLDLTTEQRLAKEISKSVYQNVQYLESVQEGFDNNLEVVLDLENQEMKYNIKRNESLIKEKENINKLLKENNDESLVDNVIVLYIDTVSRAHAHRQLKKTMEFMQQYANNNESDKEAFEYYRYHVIGTNTVPNLYNFIYESNQHGQSNCYKRDKYLKKDQKGEHIFNLFKERGFVVGLSTNTCTMNCLSRNHYEFMTEKHIIDGQADHEFYSYIYDPAYINPANYFSNASGPNSLFRRCLYGQDINQYVFDYGYQFLETYKDQKKLLYVELTDGHETTGEAVQYADQNLANFLNKLNDNNYLSEKTMVYLMSDHGQHLYKLFELMTIDTHTYRQERSLPIFQMLITRDILKKNQQIEQNVQRHQQSLFSIKQIRYTMIASTQSAETILDSNYNQDNMLADMETGRSCNQMDHVNDLTIFDPKKLCFCNNPDEKGKFEWP